MIKKSQAILDIHAAVDKFYAEQEAVSAELAKIKRAYGELERKNESLERKNQKLMKSLNKIPGRADGKRLFLDIVREIMLSPIMLLLDLKDIKLVVIAVSELLSDICANESRVKAIKVIIDEWLICKTADELLLRVWALYFKADEIIEFDKFNGSFELLFKELKIDSSNLGDYFENQTNKAISIILTKSLMSKTNLFKVDDDGSNGTRNIRRTIDFVFRLYENHDDFFNEASLNLAENTN